MGAEELLELRQAEIMTDMLNAKTKAQTDALILELAEISTALDRMLVAPTPAHSAQIQARRRISAKRSV